MFSIHKIPKGLMKKATIDIYIHFKAYTGRQIHVNNLYVSEEDYKIWYRAMRKRIIKSAPKRTSKKLLEQNIRFIEFQESPNRSLGKAIRPGYVLLIDEQHGMSNIGDTTP